jgi:hypothetical protein
LKLKYTAVTAVLVSPKADVLVVAVTPNQLFRSLSVFQRPLLSHEPPLVAS